MPKQRSHGEGALYFRKNTGRWYAEIIVGRDADGHYQFWRFSSKAKREVISAMQQRQAELREADPVVRSTQPVSRFLDQWLESVQAMRSLRTWGGYRSLVINHAAPATGQVRLCDLRPAHLQSLYASVAATHAPVTVQHLHRALHRAFEMAVRWQLLSANPAKAVDSPRVPRREQRFLSTEQAKQFLAVARDDSLYAYWVLWLTTGMRTAELAGLTWDNVNLDTGVVRVQSSLGRVPGQGWVRKDPKSHQARGIPLRQMAISALREHRLRQHEARLAAGAKWKAQNLVFCSSVGGPLEVTNVRNRHFRPILERAGLPMIRMYDLRHSCASLMVSLGVHPKVVAEMLGHSSTQLTLDLYSHARLVLARDADAAAGSSGEAQRPAIAVIPSFSVLLLFPQ
jgi:integrase